MIEGPARPGLRAHGAVLRDIAGAGHVQQIAAEARRRMSARETQARPPDAASCSVAVPDAVTLRHAERTLWTGRAGKIPMWFGPEDTYTSAFGLLWLAVASFICAMTAASSPHRQPRAARRPVSA